MFEQAVRLAGRFTFPYVGLRRAVSGEVRATLGAFVVLNEDGWALTSGHIVDDILSCERDREELAAEQSHADEPRDLCARHFELWTIPGFEQSKPRIAEARVRPLSDVALVRLESFGDWVPDELPLLRDVEAEPIEQGASVCRYGYPFHNVQAGFNEETNEFALRPDSFPVPSFALDGIVARFHRMNGNDGGCALFIETSTPGLKGQSGGPLLDVHGRICGLQSHTVHLDLGFDARFEKDGEQRTERQFLNVGAATHVADVIALLEETGIAYRMG